MISNSDVNARGTGLPLVALRSLAMNAAMRIHTERDTARPAPARSEIAQDRRDQVTLLIPMGSVCQGLIAWKTGVNTILAKHV